MSTNFVDYGLPDRELTPAELSETAAWLGRKPWHELCLDIDADRSYQERYRGGQFSTWLIHWGQTADTGFHDHDLSAGAVHVIRGRVREERLRLDGPPDVREYGPGETFTIEASESTAFCTWATSRRSPCTPTPRRSRGGRLHRGGRRTLTRHSVTYETAAAAA